MNRRPQALDNLVFGLAALLFCVLAYYAVKQIRQRRETDQATAARPADLPLSSAEANSSAGLGPLNMSGAQGVVNTVPAVGTDVAPSRSHQR